MDSNGNNRSLTDEKNGTAYDLLFRGEIAPGENIDQVKARVAESFKLDEAALNQLFSGSVVSLKRNIDRATAERISQRLFEAGAVAKIVPNISNVNASDENNSGKSTLNQPDPDNQASGASFTLAPLGSDVSENVDTPEQDQQSIPVDHLGLEPVGSNIIEQSEAERIEPVVVDTSHLTLE
ncbi:MAG: hypothetical protein ACPGF6_06355 [Porticoccaceae bacterium]